VHRYVGPSFAFVAAATCLGLACAADPGDPLKALSADTGSSASGSGGSGSGGSNGSSGASGSGSSGGSSAGSSTGSGSGSSTGGSNGGSSGGSSGSSSGAAFDAAVDSYVAPSCPMCPLKVEYFAGDPADAAGLQSISFHIAIANGGFMTQLLSELTVRYWFKGQGDAPNLKMECYYAKIGAANLTGTFTAMTTPTARADTYLEVSFGATAGSIGTSGGDTGDIQIAIHDANYGSTRFTETNDYSFDPTKTMTSCGANQGSPSCPWDHITLYRQGTLVWGIDPAGNAAGDAGSGGDAGGGSDANAGDADGG
jgi:endoglucanase